MAIEVQAPSHVAHVGYGMFPCPPPRWLVQAAAEHQAEVKGQGKSASLGKCIGVVVRAVWRTRLPPHRA